MTDAEVKRAARSARRRGTPVPARLALAAALLGFFMICLDATAVNVALPAIGRSLRGATDGLQWVLDGYTVLFAALLISAGAVSDRVGARRMLGWGLAAFTAASAGSTNCSPPTRRPTARSRPPSCSGGSCGPASAGV